MLFSIIGTDQEVGASLRVSNAEAHQTHMALIREQIAFAGPLHNDNGSRVIGWSPTFPIASRQRTGSRMNRSTRPGSRHRSKFGDLSISGHKGPGTSQRPECERL